MCRSIKVLRNSEAPPEVDEFRAAAVQFVRKISGYNKPSKVNEQAWMQAVDEIADSSRRLLGALSSNSRPSTKATVAAVHAE